MRKIYLLFLAILFNPVFSFSQDNGYISLIVGPSFPIGDFGSKAINNEAAGIANTGAIFEISFAYKLGKTFGIAAVVHGQSNPIDHDAFLGPLSLLSPTIHWTIESEGWKSAGFLAGGYCSLPVGTGNTSFESRLMLGFLRSTSPDLTITGDYSWTRLNPATSTAVAYLVGVGLKFNVGTNICLLTNLDFSGSSPEFKNVKTTSSLGVLDENTFIQDISVINLGLGVGWRL